MRGDHKTCALCMLDENRQTELWRLFQKTRSFDEVAKCFSPLGVLATSKEVRTHFQYHKLVQPPPSGHLRRTEALEKTEALPRRLQDILLLVSRIRALSATQLAELLYWDGSPERLASARNTCYRDLRRLALDDLLYRYHPTLPARARGQQRSYPEQLSLLFLGRDAVPYVEKCENRVLARREYVMRPTELKEHAIEEEQEAAEAICALARQTKILQAKDRSLNLPGAPPLNASFQSRSWLGPDQAQITFRDPRQGREETLRPGGIAVLGLEVQKGSFSVLAPFFYEHDSGARSVRELAQDLLLYLHLSRTQTLRRRFPDLPEGFLPPVVIICRNMRRVLALQEEAYKVFRGAEALPVMVIADAVTSSHHGLIGQCWLSLWDRSLEAKRYRLLEVLLKSCRPLVGRLGARDYLAAKRETSTAA